MGRSLATRCSWSPQVPGILFSKHDVFHASKLKKEQHFFHFLKKCSFEWLKIITSYNILHAEIGGKCVLSLVRSTSTVMMVVQSNHSSMNTTYWHGSRMQCNFRQSLFQTWFASVPVASCPFHVMSAWFTLWQISKRQWGRFARGWLSFLHFKSPAPALWTLHSPGGRDGDADIWPDFAQIYYC